MKNFEESEKLLCRIKGLVASRRIKFNYALPGFMVAHAKKAFIQIIVPANGLPHLRICKKEKNGGGIVIYEEQGYHLNELIGCISRYMRDEIGEGNPEEARKLIEEAF